MDRRKSRAANLLRAALLAGPLAAAGPATAEAPGPPTTVTVEALAGLRSPFLHERLEAVERLVELGASARPAVIAALASEGPPARRHLADVLGRDASTEAVAALVGALPEADAETAASLRTAIVAHAERAAPLVERRLREADEAPPRLRDLDALLRRARVERIFLGARSKSGGTGYYRGQFDALLPYRKDAVAVCFAILADRTWKVPEEVPVGGYRFLRDPDPPVDPLGARAMAGNALAELLRPTDEETIDALRALYREYKRHAILNPAYQVRDMTDQELLLDTILPAVHRVEPDEWSFAEVEWLLEHYGGRSGRDSSAMLLLRVGRYQEAIDQYRNMIKDGDTAYSHYNIACAYATWSREEPRNAKAHREEAIRSLQDAVRNGYPDWPWMEQDTDLDPIRGDPRYKALLEQLKREFLVPAGAEAPR